MLKYQFTSFYRTCSYKTNIIYLLDLSFNHSGHIDLTFDLLFDKFRFAKLSIAKSNHRCDINIIIL